MIDSQAILHTAGNYDGSDEKYTPAYAIKPILKYIPKDWVVWCPFDLESSNYVKLIRQNGNKVIRSHISEDKDFFEYEPQEHWDCIISNPPYRGKRKFFERALELNKSFIFLMTLACFNDKYPMWSFYEHGKQPQVMKFDKRIHFINPDGSIHKKTTFQSGYIGYGFFEQDFTLTTV